MSSVTFPAHHLDKWLNDTPEDVHVCGHCHTPVTGDGDGIIIEDRQAGDFVICERCEVAAFDDAVEMIRWDMSGLLKNKSKAQEILLKQHRMFLAELMSRY